MIRQTVCPYCGSEWDVSTYPPGSQFACSCGQTVTVPADQPAAQPRSYGGPQARRGRQGPPQAQARHGYPQQQYAPAPGYEQGYPDAYGYGAPATPDNRKRLGLIIAAAAGAVVVLAVIVSVVVMAGGGDDGGGKKDGPVPKVKTAADIARENYADNTKRAGKNVDAHFRLIEKLKPLKLEDLINKEYAKILDLARDDIVVATKDDTPEELLPVLESLDYRWTTYYVEDEGADEWVPVKPYEKKSEWLTSTDSKKREKSVAEYREYVEDPYTQEVARLMRKVVNITRLPPEDWAVGVKAPYVIFLQRTKRFAYKMAFDEYHEMLCDVLFTEWKKIVGDIPGVRLPDKKRLQPFVLFKDYEDYMKHLEVQMGGRNPGIGGHYSSELNLMFTYKSSDVKGTVFHECTHQLQYNSRADGVGIRFMNANAPMWWLEGMAEYMSGFKRDGRTGEYILFQLQTDRIPGAKMCVAGRIRMPDKAFNLLNLISLGRNTAMHPVYGTWIYSGGWTLVHFLNQGADGKYREYFKKFSEIFLTTGKGDLGDFRKAFEGVDLAQLETEWFEYVRNMETE